MFLFKLCYSAFREFLECSHHTVRRKCGEETAEFTKDFLDRMSDSLIKVSMSSFYFHNSHIFYTERKNIHFQQKILNSSIYLLK